MNPVFPSSEVFLAVATSRVLHDSSSLFEACPSQIGQHRWQQEHILGGSVLMVE